MSATVTVRLTYTPPRFSWRSDTRWLPYTWAALTGEQLLATGQFRATRDECIADITALFGNTTNVMLVESDKPTILGFTHWPIRRAVSA